MDAVLRLCRWVFFVLNALMGVLFVMTIAESCGSVFELRVGYALVGHVMITSVVGDEFECQQKCITNKTCKSFNIHPGADNTKHICELYNKTRQMKSADFKKKKGSIYYGSAKLPEKTSYRGISSDQMLLKNTAMKELRAHLSFTQLRFHCSKKQGRAFHVKTAANSSGEAVERYFRGQTDVMPGSCGSFVRMENDNSSLAEVCEKWGGVNGTYRVAKWGGFGEIIDAESRLYDHPAFVYLKYHWLLSITLSRWECDDFNDKDFSSGFWKVFVR